MVHILEFAILQMAFSRNCCFLNANLAFYTKKKLHAIDCAKKIPKYQYVSNWIAPVQTFLPISKDRP